MKMRVEIEEGIEEDEIVIRCQHISPAVMKLEQMIEEITKGSKEYTFYKGDTEYYLSGEDILFFETDASGINVHTIDNVYQTKYKLYELEDVLPGNFVRISKSAIVNSDKIYSISRNLTASSLIQFQGTHKQIYVSRSYYKVLKSKLEEKRLKR